MLRNLKTLRARTWIRKLVAPHTLVQHGSPYWMG